MCTEACVFLSIVPSCVTVLHFGNGEVVDVFSVQRLVKNEVKCY